MQNLVTQAQLARKVGLKKETVTQLASRALKAARVGKKIDLNHEAARVWLAKRGIKLQEPTGSALESEDDGTAATIIAVQHMTIAQIVKEFGGDAQLINWLKSLSVHEGTREKRWKSGKATGELLPRKDAEPQIFGPLEELSQRLLRDMARTLVKICREDAKTSVPTPSTDTAAKVAEAFARVVREARSKVKRGFATLEDQEPKRETEETEEQ